jgi:hypothetical protein
LERDVWYNLVNTAMNLQIPYISENSSKLENMFSLSRRTLLREVNFLFAPALGKCIFDVNGSSMFLRNSGAYLSD